MFENITLDEVVLLERALNTERNVIERAIGNSTGSMHREFKEQLVLITKMFQEAQEKDAELTEKETVNG